MSSRTSRQARRRRERSHAKRPVQRGGSRWPLLGGIAVVIAVIAFLVWQSSGLGGSKNASGPPTIDGVQCGANTQIVYHIHQYVELYDHGKRVQLPSEIGIPGTEVNPTCFYWIHVHASTANVIHVESPVAKTFTFGNFVNIWKETKDFASPPGDAFLRKLQQAQQSGTLTAFYNLKPWHRSYTLMPLKSHAIITLEIGKPIVPPSKYNFGTL